MVYKKNKIWIVKMIITFRWFLMGRRNKFQFPCILKKFKWSEGPAGACAVASFTIQNTLTGLKLALQTENNLWLYCIQFLMSLCKKNQIIIFKKRIFPCPLLSWMLNVKIFVCPSNLLWDWDLYREAAKKLIFNGRAIKTTSPPPIEINGRRNFFCKIIKTKKNP